MTEYALIGYKLGLKWYAPWRDSKMTMRRLRGKRRALMHAEAREAFRLGWDRAAISYHNLEAA